METLFLETGTHMACKVHPVVLLSVLDHYLRRHEDQNRVIGTLLGNVQNGVIEITNCFPVPHVEKADEDTVSVGKDFNKSMLALHKRVNPKERIVGWYATAVKGAMPITEISCRIHDFYGEECTRPVHLVVDTLLRQPKIAVKAFISSPLAVATSVMHKFHQLKIDIETSEAEKIGLSMMMHGLNAKGTISLDGDMAGLESAMKKLLRMLQTVSGYVDDVVAGRAQPDVAVGRRISDAVTSVPAVDPTVFQKMFGDSVADLLMVVYLSQLARTQLAIAEKLTTKTQR